jgi:hypothetical protein
MKKIFFLFAIFASVAASATVTVTPLGTDYAAKKVTFKVAWTNSPNAPYNNRVWIWIDFCPVSGVTPQSFSTATITNPTRSGNGTITGLNGRGFFIEYNTTNSGTTVTATLSNAPAGQFNWCAYGSDYPPNVLANTNGSYTLAGTPPFKLVTANGATTQTVNEKTFATSAITITPATITDATGYPGLWCPYTGNDLYMDDTHRCKERQSGAKKWEAYIKDSRDNQIYRITQFSDNTWWFADDLAIDANTFGICNGVHFYIGSSRPACPTNWKIPTDVQFSTRWPDYCGSTADVNDVYGAPIPATCYYGPFCGNSAAACRDCNGRRDYVISNHVAALHRLATSGCAWNCSAADVENRIGGRVRCMR